MKVLFGRFAFFAFILFYSIVGYSQVLITSTGTLNNFIVNYPANISVLQSGMEITFFSNQTITNSPSLNVNLTGLRPIFKNVNQSLSNGEIKAGQAVTVVFDGTNWQLMSTVSPSTATGFWSTLGNVSDSTANYIGTINNQPLTFYTSGSERMRISRAGRFGFNMNPTAASMFNIKSIGNGAILTVNRSTDSGALIELTETGGGNARIDMYNSLNANVVQIPSGGGNIFFAGGGNLGVNTTAPGNTLHVAGGGRFTNLSSAGTSFVTADNLGNLQITTNTGFIGGTGTQNQLAFFSSANTITSSGNMLFSPGSSALSLGIISLASGTGSFAIGSNVSVTGPRSLGIGNFINISNLGNVAFGDWSLSTPTTLTSSTDDQFLARFANGYRLFTRANLSDGVFISSLGQGGLGIGALSNTHRLFVNATTIAGAEGLARFAVPDASGAYLDILNASNANANFLPKIQSNTVGLNAGLVMESLQNNDVLSHPSMFQFNAGLAGPLIPFGSRQLFEIQNGGQLRFRVSSDGTTRIASLTSGGNNFVQANSVGDLFISTNTGQSPFWALGGNSVPGIRTIGTSNNFDIPFIANNIERMRINSLGRIGINTSTPGVLLDIKGTSTGTSTAFRILDSNNAASFNVLDNGATGIGTAAFSGYQLYLNTATADPNYISLYINNLYSGVVTKYGIYNNVSGDGSGAKYCLYNNMDGLAGDNSSIFGTYNNVDPVGTGIAYGSYTNITPLGTNIRYGNFINLTGAANNASNLFGNYISVSHQSTAAGTSTYVLFGNNTSNANGTKYGVYMQGEEQNILNGNLGLGITTPTEKLDVSGNAEVTGDYKYASPKIRYKSLSAASFTVESNLYYLNHVGSSAYVSGGTLGLTATLYANLDLPDNSTITGLYFYYVDNNVTYGVGPAFIYEVQSNIGVTPTFTTNFNTTASTAAANAPTILLQSNLSDTPLLVDNDTKSYMVVLSTIQNTSTVRIVRCRVRYIVPNAD